MNDINDIEGRVRRLERSSAELNESIVRVLNMLEELILQNDQRLQTIEERQDRFNEQVLGNQTEIRRLWEYLTSQRPNGHQ